MASSWERVSVNGLDMGLYLSLPPGAGHFPAVVVSHHGGGVDQFIRDIADRLAAEGYVAAAPDLYHRITDNMVADGSKKFHHLNDSDTVDDINATVGFLQSCPFVNDLGIGITGFSLGGRVAWLAACTNSHIKAAVPYYGGNIMVPMGKTTQAPSELAGGIKCQILFHFGEIDENPSQADMRNLDNELTSFGIAHQFYIYPGADHAFMDYTGSRYHKDASDISWLRTLVFFAQQVKGAPVG